MAREALRSSALERKSSVIKERPLFLGDAALIVRLRRCKDVLWDMNGSIARS